MVEAAFVTHFPIPPICLYLLFTWVTLTDIATDRHLCERAKLTLLDAILYLE